MNGPGSIEQVAPVALVTGAAGGIGREIALLLDREGYRLVLVDVSESGLGRVAGELRRTPRCIATDITQLPNVQRIREEVLAAHGRLDVLVNNAGVVVTTPFEEASYEEIERELGVNYRSILYFMREFVPVMKARGGGSVVSNCSLGGILPLKEAPGYCGTKFGLRGFMLSQSLALRRFGIRVSTVYPTAVDTPMLRHEAVHGGSLMNFVSEPQRPAAVARAVLRAIRTGKREIAVPWSEGWLCKLLGAFPALIPLLLPILEPIARRNRRRYVAQRGLADPDRRAGEQASPAA
jgi:short-subunit dehydrogenase